MPSKRRSVSAEDDFVYTISDNEEVPEEHIPPPKKKAKTNASTGKKSKKQAENEVEGDEGAEGGIWGDNDEDDEAMDPDFEFADVDAGFGTEDFEGWGFDGAKKAMKTAEKRGVDIDEIIRRRRQGKDATNGDTNGEDDEEGEEEEEEEVENDMDVDLDDEDDQVLADDAFGMNAGSDDEGSADEGAKVVEDDEDEPASDNDSVATPLAHPDDDMSDASEEEDAEEAAKRDAFFAPAEKEKKGKASEASSFMTMSLSRPILRGLAAVGFTKPTPIQAKTIPIALMGKDLVGGAVTGSGKTGAFVVPILERLLYRPNKVPTTRVVILTPTRELAIQCHAVATKLAAHTDIKFTLTVGGLSLKVQESELRMRPDVIIATPGRFIDHMRNSASFSVDTVEILVLDEADRMLEDGFADELNEILTTLPKSRQTMLFSATMTSTVDRLIRVGLNKPARIMVDSQKKTVGTLVQEFVRLRPGREEKRMGYLLYLCKTVYTEKVIIFFRQKKEAHRARIIFSLFNLSCAELHGSMNQTQRIASVEDFRDGKVSFLLATDLASRGLDIKGVDTVINYEAPQSLEIYVHRVGRTARAGRKGTALTIAAEPDRKVVKAAVRAGKAQGAKIASRVIEPSVADKWQSQIDELEEEIEEIMKEEKEEKQMAQAEMHIKKGENLIDHEAEIKSRPKRTWFETEHDKKQAKQAGKDELNGLREAMKQRTGKLSNKDKKRLDAKALRTDSRTWKKTKTSEEEVAKAKAKGKKTAGKGGVKKAPGNARMRAKLKPKPSTNTASSSLPCQVGLTLANDHELPSLQNLSGRRPAAGQAAPPPTGLSTEPAAHISCHRHSVPASNPRRRFCSACARLLRAHRYQTIGPPEKSRRHLHHIIPTLAAAALSWLSPLLPGQTLCHWMLCLRALGPQKAICPSSWPSPLITPVSSLNCNKAAAIRFFGSGRQNPRRTQGFLRSLVPLAIRDRYRRRVIDFHLNVLPRWKHRLQAWVYRRIVQHQLRRSTRRRRSLVGLVRKQGRRLLSGNPRLPQQAKDAKGRSMASGPNRIPSLGVLSSSYIPGIISNGTSSEEGRGDRGYRRKKLAAMAGNLYRTGQQAVTEIRESYAQTRARGLDGDFDNQGSLHIPGAFPDVAITVQGNEHLVIFPSYAKQHIKQEWTDETAHHSEEQHGSIKDEDFWRREWERNEDERAIVDVDVRGWVYSPHVGPLTRRNRILIGLARQLSGIPMPRPDGTASGSPGTPGSSSSAPFPMNEDLREQEKIAKEAARIERKGQEEKRVAGQGGYSEDSPGMVDADVEGMSLFRGRRGSQTPDSTPGSPVVSGKQGSAAASSELTEAELAVANVNLMARVAPFMTNPLVALPITIMFYNDEKSQSRTVMTNDAGHFIIRAALDFVPTTVRVLANEKLSATQEVKITEPFGVSMISDIDDTIKRSSISLGAKEIFRNTFVRELADLTIDGVKEWYGELHKMGVSIHYCSNSPWQLFPVLASFFKLNGLPPGSLHLKQYSGMLQGIFEPVAERKKSTLTRLMRDFPTRKFLLVGDSGEADLEVYTELALAHPGRILAIFIRDVTTPEEPGYFDSGFEYMQRKAQGSSFDVSQSASGTGTIRQNSAPTPGNGAKPSTGPLMGTLIDFSEEPEEVTLDRQAMLKQAAASKPGPHRAVTSAELLASRKGPPPKRPAKPVSLRSAPSNPDLPSGVGLGLSRRDTSSSEPPAPPLPRRPQVEGNDKPHPLAQMHNSSQQTMGGTPVTAAPTNKETTKERPTPPLPRRRGPNMKNLSPRLFGNARDKSSNSDIDFDPLPPAAVVPPNVSYSRTGTRSASGTPTGSPTMGPANRKLDLWRRRLARAHEALDQQGVALYTWRRGQDVMHEAVGIVQGALKELEKNNKESMTGQEKEVRDRNGLELSVSLLMIELFSFCLAGNP
ncbi:hypothetical protein S40293_01875 [Stachybotrys chartarum IBT 40293]|nr:hypothetical protein S40293_01875 [Stachybotrys chartarum IBT 40293]